MGNCICVSFWIASALPAVGAMAVAFSLLAFFFGFKWYGIKQQLRKMGKQLEMHNHVSVEFVDRDLEAAALQANRLLDQVQEVQAEAAKREKNIKASISLVSHDMRTPLTSVIGYLQLAGKSCQEEKVLQDLTIALDRAEHCSRLVNDFFELSALDSGEYTPVMEQVNICEVVCEEILAGHPEFEKSGITPEFCQADDVVFIMADRGMLARVIQNLISNAVKYAAGDVTFTVEKGDRVTLYIVSPVSGHVDTGKIFDKYYREESSHNRAGKGLGLYICRKFMESMGGEITAFCEGNLLTVKVEFATG